MTSQSNPRISVIINNYNYADFIVTAIDSVLQQTYRNTEVIVVDDGSTDRSREILRGYESKVKLVFKENGGEASGRNEGFLHATGDIVAFLDADDYWLPHAIASVVGQWNCSFTKLQFPLMVIDESGEKIGSRMPRCRLDSGRVDELLLTTGRYITTPTSGNFYSRSFLEKIFPVPLEDWPRSSDSYAATYSGFYGEIGAIQEPLGYYRVHRRNATRIVRTGVDLAQIQMLIEHGRWLRRLIEKIANERKLPFRSDIVIGHWLFLKLELARRRLSPGSSARETAICAWRMTRSVAAARELDLPRKAEMLLWTAATALLPLSMARQVVNLAFELAPKSRFFRALRSY